MSSYPELEKKLLKAKIELMTRSTFIASVCSDVKHLITTETKTADTNNICARYNPEFMGELTIQEVTFVIAHEMWHILLHHIARRNSRDVTVWNYACDHQINLMLKKARFDVLPYVLQDPQFEDMSADQIYNILINDPETANQEPTMMDITGEGFNMDPDEFGEAAQAQADIIDNMIVRADMRSRISGEDRGFLPNDILIRIDQLTNPKLPWNILLQNFFTKRIKTKYNWSRRSRRFSSVYLPSRFSKGLGNLTFAIDSSGSMLTHEQWVEVLSEIKGIQQQFRPEKMIILDCDAKIHNVHEVTPDMDILSLQFNGGGGTRFEPVFEYLEDNPTDALIYFTDLHASFDFEPPDYPLLWVCSSDHDPAPFGETIYIN